MSELHLSKADLDEINRLIAEFRGESDRAAVVLSAAKLDLQLFQILDRVLRPSPNGRDDLLDGDGPISTFSSRINLAYRLGIISADLAKALHLVRKIRNAFAHELAGVSLSNGSHGDRVRELVAPMLGNWAYDVVLKEFGGENASPQAQFRAAVTLLMLRLEGAFKGASSCVARGTWNLLPERPASASAEASLEDPGQADQK